MPEMKRVFTLNHFLKKRETFFDVHAGIPFFSGSSFRGKDVYKRQIQDRLFMSDFDKYMLELEENAKK